MDIQELKYLNNRLHEYHNLEQGRAASETDLINIFTAVKKVFDQIDQKKTKFDELREIQLTILIKS